MSHGIDYSKWDQLVCSSDESTCSDSESHIGEPVFNNEAYPSSGKATVTKLSYPSRVTVGPGGVHLHATPPTATESPFRTVPQPRELAPTTPMGEQTRPAAPDAHAIEEEELLFHNLTRNGTREGNSHLWCQTADSVTVSFLVPLGTRSKHIGNFRVCNTDNPNDVPIRRTTIEFTVLPCDGSSATGPLSHIQRTFRYCVKDEEDLLAGSWQLLSIPSEGLRLMVVELFKEPVGSGITHWWDKCFVTDTATVETTQLAGRGTASDTRKAELAAVWTEAHDEFKRRLRKRKSDPS